MKEVDILITVKYSENIEEGDVLWAIDKLQECDVIHNIGYDWDDLNTRSKVVARREGGARR